MSDHQEYGKLGDQLAAAGLNLSAVLPVSLLDSQAVAALPVFGKAPRDQQTLLLVGNAGPAFWTACQSAQQQAGVAQPLNDPVDRFAVAQTTHALKALLPEDRWKLLYPALPGSDLPPCNISLQRLGVLAGWHQPSPLGIGIHPEYGLWFAYRTLVLLDMDRAGAQVTLGLAPAVQSCALAASQATSSVCAECTSQDCVTSCPASALAFGRQPDMRRCTDYRLRDNSRCADRCLARNACPVGSAVRYTAAQSEYHYSVSLESIKRWKQSGRT